MKTWMKISLAAVLALGAGGYGAYRYARGGVGASSAYGGSLEAVVVPEFKNVEQAAWANGKPASLGSLRGAPVMIEVWSPG